MLGSLDSQEGSQLPPAEVGDDLTSTAHFLWLTATSGLFNENFPRRLHRIPRKSCLLLITPPQCSDPLYTRYPSLVLRSCPRVLGYG